jgi:hypothetical protein
MAAGNTLIVLTARDAIPTATAGAPHALFAGAASPAEGVPVIAFDSGTDENVDFVCIMPRHYGGGGITLTLMWASTQTSNAVVWNAAFRAVPDDTEDVNTTAHSYDFNAVTATTASAAGEFDYAAITFTDGADMDSVAAGEMFILRVKRDADNGSDNMTGDAYLAAIEVRETP